MHAATGPQTGALARLGLAVALSALLHALLLGGVSVRRQASEPPHTAALTARLERIEASQGGRPAQAVTADQGLAMADVLPAYRSPGTMPDTLSNDAPRTALSGDVQPVTPGQSGASGESRSLAAHRRSPVVAPQTAVRDASETRSHGLAASTSPEAASVSAAPVDARLQSTTPMPAPPLAPYDPRPPMEVPVIVDSTVYETRDLDDLPVSLAPIEPRFPDSAARAGISGSVTLEVRIDEFGMVREARVIDAVPAGHFEASALESFRSARFTAARRDGHAVRCKLVIKVDFAPAR